MEADHKLANTTLTSGESFSARRVFNPRRFDLARRRRGLKKLELAAAIDIDRKTVLNYESGQEPRPEILGRLCSELRFPEAFFFGEDIEEISVDSVSFRSMARMKASHQDQAIGQGSLCVYLNDWFGKHFTMPENRIPDIKLATPEAAAAIVRIEWALGVQPVANMIHLLESKGVRVYSLSVKAKEVDAFSTWKGDTPFVFLNVEKSSEHSRFDAAHELAHLVLHRSGAPVGKEAETEAHRFAAAFLMPEEDVRAHTRPNPGIVNLLQWKKRWKVSLSALNFRMHRLGMTTEHHYKKLCVQISAMGGRTSEMDGIPRERSLLLEKVLRMLSQDGISRSDIARELAIPTAELDEMMFGLTMTAIEGGRTGDPIPRTSPSNLSLVPNPHGGAS
jgi:Zn-dependent peptidase ImmA (M78 family)/DNA-binding XRE family transcriptional regulator